MSPFRNLFRLSMLTDTRSVFPWVWIVVVIVAGLLIGLHPGWVAFIAILPTSYMGFQLLITGHVGTATSTVPPFVSMPGIPENDLRRLRVLSREVERAANALLAVSPQQSGSIEQSAVIARATRTLEDFNAMADRARREAVHLSVISKQTTAVAQNGQAALQSASDGINQMEQQVAEMVQLLNTLARHLRRISEINAAVNEIATQSNFLALNAAIEAARAGEQGRSFAMVANEVRMLSEQARESVGQIRDVLTQIHKAMKQTLEATVVEAQAVETGSSLAEQARDAIDKLSENLKESSGTVQKILAAIDHQSSSLEGLVSAINSIGQSTLQNQAGFRLAQNVAHDLSSISEELNTIASIGTPDSALIGADGHAIG